MRVLYNIWKRLQTTPFFAGTDFKINFLLGLGLFTFIIIGVDLGSELAVDRDEINSVVATLDESISSQLLNNSDNIIVNQPQTGIIIQSDFYYYTTELYNIPQDRAPPLTVS